MISNIQDLLELHEGRRNKMYLDSKGVPSIGVGHNLRDKPLRDEAVDLIFKHDVEDAIDDAVEVFGDDIFGTPVLLGLDEVRQAACIDLSFNLGRRKLAEFKQFIEAVRHGDWVRAGEELVDSRWFHQVGNRGPRLRDMIVSGEWPAK